jgi:hypothetical protein
MSALAELLPLDTDLKIPEIETYRGFESLPSPDRSRLLYQLLLEIDFQGQRRALAKPLRLKLVHEEEGWFAENEALNLFGVGDSPMKAIEDFRRHFEHFLHRYCSLDWSEVSGEGLRLKDLYRRLLVSDAT